MKSFIILISILVLLISVLAFDRDQRTSISNNILSIQQKPNFLIKRQSRKYNKRKERNCKHKVCSLDLKPCPKDCPQSCGYMNSPDPCCPLLGKPTCPDL